MIVSGTALFDEQCDVQIIIEAVMPLKIDVHKNASDLDRFCSFFLPSFDLFFLDKDHFKLSLIVPPDELSIVARRIRELGRSNIGMISEDDICPNLKGCSGWHKQQLLKLAAAKVVASDYYLVLDSDVVLTRPVAMSDLFPSGKPIFQRQKAGEHWEWWESSRQILKSKVLPPKESLVMDVTPEFLHRRTCLQLQRAIAWRNRRIRWDKYLFDLRHLGWTEFSLYWLYVLERKLEHKLYDWSSRKKLYEGVWLQESLSQDHLQPKFTPDSDSFFLVIQSNLGLPLSFIQQQLSPYLRPRTKQPETNFAR